MKEIEKMTAKIVVIDDEPQLRRMLRIALKSSGYDALEADCAAVGLELIVLQQPDLVLLDLGLPDMDGMQLLAELRTWSQVPVIVLSVRNSFSEKVKALDTGAQDYVTKPFSIEELLARIRANLRDQREVPTFPQLDDGHLAIDLARRLVSIAGVRVELTPKEYAFLACLAKSPNCVITQAQLMRDIWGPVHQKDTHYLRIIVSHLRQKLGDDSARPRYIVTEAGVGYRLMFDGRG